MRFYYASDVHHDYNGDFIFEHALPEDAGSSFLILAGDISSKGRTISVLEKYAKIFKYVVAVAGNHDWYDLAVHETHKFVHNIPNVFWLDNSIIEIGGVTLAGTTLWHELDPISEIEWRYYMNDAKYIRGRNWTRCNHYTIMEMHNKALNFIAETKADILVTHHGLSNKSISDRYRGANTNKFYITHRSDLLSGYKHYVHGHVHASFEYEELGCQIHCNPHGYAIETRKGHRDMENIDFSYLRHFDI